MLTLLGCVGDQLEEFVTSVDQGVTIFREVGNLVLDFARKVNDQPWAQRVAKVATKALEMADIVADIVDKVQTYIDVAQKILDVDALADMLRAEVQRILGMAVDKVDALVESLATALRNVVNQAASTLFGLIAKLEAFVSDALETVVAHMKEQLLPFAAVATKVRDTVSDVRSAIDGGIDFQSLASWVADQLESVLAATLDTSGLQPALDVFDGALGTVLQVHTLVFCFFELLVCD